MISFFKNPHHLHFAVQHKQAFSSNDIAKLSWLFGNATLLKETQLDGIFLGPRKEMITPWSTNAVEITQNMGLKGIERIEELLIHDGGAFDPMLKAVYHHPGQSIFDIEVAPHPILDVEDIATYNQSEGLALTDDEVDYLLGVAKQLGRPLTDSEVFGFSQVNSEHCRHKIFNGSFVIDGKEQPSTLFQLIKKTSKEQPGRLVSAYKDNVAFVKGPVVQQFAPKTQDKPDYFTQKDFASVLSLKAETHNFPTTVEPFNGAATGSGGEIRDRMAGGQGSVPLAGTAVYMTSYSRLEEGRSWEQNAPERPWLYQTPADILIKASNGASDFGNKFGQPLICGSVLTFEHQEGEDTFGFDKVIMQAGGVGYGKESDSIKQEVTKGDKIVILGGDNYRIGMGGGAVSSVDTGEFANAIELNAVQRSNPEMQKRVANAVRAMTEMDINPIVSIHDHGAGGHLNCLSELVEDTGGQIAVSKLPLGDPTLSEKEIIGNESQERMGLVIKDKDINLLQAIAERERSPMFEVGEATGDHRFTFKGREGKNPIDWKLSHMFGSSPKTVLTDDSSTKVFSKLSYDVEKVEEYLESVLQLEAVACKDWLTNKVDRCVTGRVATQQTTGEIQLPLNNVAVMALDFVSNKGVATSIGHAPIPAMVDVAAGSRLAITEALTNLIWAPIADGLSGVSLSANWMWPAKNDGENYRLYKAVEAVSAYAIALGINIPTGKDSLSMTQKYPDGTKVLAPGTVVISSIGEVTDINKVVTPELKKVDDTVLLYVPIGNQKPTLGGSSLAQIIGQLGTETPDISSPDYFKNLFSTIQSTIDDGLILAGHDVSSGGLITTLLEMNFPNSSGGMSIDLTEMQGDAVEQLFNENPALVLQCQVETKAMLEDRGIQYLEIGAPQRGRKVSVKSANLDLNLDIDSYRDIWYKTSFL
ncbi:MAG: phosphoribosylformylglycinamidine synthase, partial [Cyclobacteriaceae bacterium]